MADIVIKISGNIDSYEEAMDQALEKTEGLQSGLDSIAQKAAIAFTALTAEIGLSVAAFAESQAATNKLTNAMQNQGIYSDALLKKYQGQAAALQTLTGVDDDAIVSATALAQAQLGNIEITQELQQSFLDLAAARDIDLQSATDLISKGINGNVVGLQKLGIEVDKNASQQERLSSILGQVSVKFGGAAETANRGVGGIKGLTSAFGDLQEEIGARFAPLIERAIQGMTAFINVIKENQSFINFAAGAIAAGVAVSGMIAILASAGSAFLVLQASVAAAGLSLSAVLGPVGLLGIALGAAAGALGYFAAQQVTAGSQSDKLAAQASDLRAEIQDLEKTMKNTSSFFLTGGEAERLAKAKSELQQIDELLERDLIRQQQKAAATTEQDPAKAAAAQQARNDAEFAKQQEHDLLMAQQQLESQQLAADLRAGDQLQQTDALIAFHDKKIAQATSVEEKLNLMRDKGNLIMLKGQQEANKSFLANQKKTDEEREANQRSTLNTIATLQTSSNETLAAIGKAAALVQIAIDTPVAVGRALAAFPPPINFIAAGAVGAAMAVQAARVAGIQFAEGGMVTGGIRGRDSVPATYMPGELVVPTKNFEEVVGAVRNSREGGGGYAMIELRAEKGGFMDFIEAQLVERGNLGISFVRV